MRFWYCPLTAPLRCFNRTHPIRLFSTRRCIFSPTHTFLTPPVCLSPARAFLAPPYSVVGADYPWRNSSVVGPFDPTNTTPPFIQAFDPSFVELVGPNATIRLIASNPGFAFAHEAPIYVPDLDVVFFTHTFIVLSTYFQPHQATAENAATAAACSHGASSATAGNANSTRMAQRHSANARGEEDHTRAKRPQQRSVNAHGECPHTWAEQHISHATRDTSRDAKRPKRPTKRANPPRRRGRLKVQSDSSSDASEMDARCWGSIIGPPGPNLKDSEPATRRPRTSDSPMQDAPRLTKSGNRASVALRNALQVIYGYGFYSLVY
ncbi:hypothetical protein BU15DRAFT_74295 [Melanogaster broomeanus]|nr:hypothetical protein BU15DRAFT_74295 [Melanogaster broomeanus]